MIGKGDQFRCLNKGEGGDKMKFLDALISNGIFLLVIGMVLYLATTILAIARLGNIVDCPICINVDTVSSELIVTE